MNAIAVRRGLLTRFFAPPSCAAAAMGVFLLAVSGCATRPPASDTGARAAYEEANDPLEPLNRYFFELTNFADFLFLRPVAEVYDDLMPRFARKGLRNFSENLSTPLTLGHDILQGSWRRAGESLARLLLNSTLGIAGLIDVAAMIGIPAHSEDAGQTLAVYGVPEGPYIFLPFLGPSSLRAASGGVADYYADPIGYVPIEGRRFIRLVAGAASVVDFRAGTLDVLSQVERTSIDYYAVLRELYRQNRRREILNGEIDISTLPDLSDDFDFDMEEEAFHQDDSISRGLLP